MSQELREEIAKLRQVGSLMSNVCYNLSQNNTTINDPNSKKYMEDLYKQWDKIKRN